MEYLGTRQNMDFRVGRMTTPSENNATDIAATPTDRCSTQGVEQEVRLRLLYWV